MKLQVYITTDTYRRMHSRLIISPNWKQTNVHKKDLCERSLTEVLFIRAQNQKQCKNLQRKNRYNVMSPNVVLFINENE